MQKLVWQNADGVELDLTSGNYGITEWEGFSGTGLNIQSQTVPFQDGGVFLDALIEQRTLSVTLAMQDNNNLETRYQQRREIISALNPKLGEGYLIYTNDYISKRIKCIPQIPVFENHNSDVAGTPKASLSWTACEPYWEDLNETEVVISANSNEEIINEGDVAVGIEIQTTDGETSFIISNQQQNKMIFLQSYYPFPTLHINTKVGQKSIKGNGLFSEQGREYTITTDLQNPDVIKSEIIKIGEYYYTFSENPTLEKIVLIKSKDLPEWEQVGNILDKEDFGAGSIENYNMQIIYNDNKIYVLDKSNSILSVSEDVGLTWTHQTTTYTSMCLNKNTGEMFFSTEGMGEYSACAYNPLSKDVIEVWIEQGDEKIRIYRGSETIEKTIENKSINRVKILVNSNGLYIVYSTDAQTGKVLVLDINGNTINYSTGGVGVFEWQEKSDGYYGVYNVPFVEGTSGVAFMSKDFQTTDINIQSFPHHTSVAQVIDGLMYVFDYIENVIYSTKSDVNNFINNLVIGSDMTLGLDVGNNRITVMSKYDITITYRQKYIGV